ncbi:hypothetical protein SPRG_03031 [Saprolegnia parasitica CBS 223.65]|uniref:PIPK domain-containing protein n=1 Tax=Saprolegnia parasitica (strain CBS 223.65) TaxID=695850 RepID=A0A067D1A7_SAPPC|nr:hypothetical protein SPRG_03031 [Saprolegnia parasitica CBS 223.65]KDO32556.1 hypothetical protein SPRG_03031 [Saprolegnia parasitica CBS 223.65]|eukprot:XP_012197002.1 hypothetical protein SPRG_03031 [Saprolegnia parasitica CBS 223.65]
MALALSAVLLALALCVLCATVYLVAVHPKARQHPGPVLLCILISHALAIAFRAVMHLVLLAVDGRSDYSIVDVANLQPDPVALWLFWTMVFFTSAATFWNLMLAIDLISSLLNPFLPFQANSVLHHAVAWPGAALWTTLFRTFVCANGDSRHTGIYMDVPLYLGLLYIAIALFVAWRKSRILETQAHLTTRRMAKRILPYLGVFASVGIASIVVYTVDVLHGGASSTTSIIDEVVEGLDLVAVFALFRLDVVGRRRADTVRCTNDDDDEDRTAGNEHDDLDVSNVLRQSIMKYTSMGIIESASRAAMEPRAEIAFDDYARVEAKTIVVHGRFASSVLAFEDVAPAVFQHLRHHFGIDDRSYMEAFALDQILNEHGSEGKSGNLFYFTANRQFMVKSVPRGEFDVLRGILPYYHSHLQSHPGSYLCRYLGCHSISLPVGSKKMYFVVMHNLFKDGPVHQRFDLKGNTDRRQAIRSDDVERVIRQARERLPIAKLMMDIDFLKLRQAIHVDDDVQIEMQAQLVADIMFLAARGIMDYSILIGVAHGSLQDVPQHAAVVSKYRDKFYYVGVIDMLQRYTWRWTLQRYVLGLCLCKDMHNVSAVSPNEYGSRLKHFVRNRLFYAPCRDGRSLALASSSDTHPIRLSYDLEDTLSPSPYIAVFSKNPSPHEILIKDRVPAFFVGT